MSPGYGAGRALAVGCHLRPRDGLEALQQSKAGALVL